MGALEPPPRYVRYPRKTDALGAADLTRRSREISKPLATHGFIPLVTVFTVNALNVFEKTGNRLSLYTAVLGILACLVGGVLTVKKLGTALDWNPNLPFACGGALALNAVVWWMNSEGRFSMTVLVPLVCALAEMAIVFGSVNVSLRRRALLRAAQSSQDGIPSYLPPPG